MASKREAFGDARVARSLCPFCAVGCATLIRHRGNTVVGVEGDPASPINEGSLCAKGAAIQALHESPERWTACRYRAPGASEWQEVSLNWALDRIAERIKQTRDASFQEVDEHGRRVMRTLALASLGGASLDNEEIYLAVKLLRGLGVVFLESQVRLEHSASAAALGATFGAGAATTFLTDLERADLIVIQGSNFAECQPVGFRFVTKAKEHGATVVHVDPRFTRTSALADLYVPLRAGTDAALLSGLINYVLTNERYFADYVLRFTDAAWLVDDAYRDSEDLDGLFGGFDRERVTYDAASWRYAGARDDTLRDPRCVLNVLRRHVARYTPEMVERICGTPRDRFLRLAQLLCEHSGRERTTVYCHATGLTQHTTGTQNVRAAAILQTLLGNVGRPGGGILTLRGHAGAQGAADLGMLSDALPGQLPAPTLERGETTFASWCAAHAAAGASADDFAKHAVSLLRAWFGDAATPAADWAFDYLPKRTGDHSLLPMLVAMKDGTIRGLFLLGANPAVGGPNAEFARAALAKLDWLVVRDTFETESAAFWRRAGADPKQIPTEVFFVPAAVIAEKAGTFTNTTRLLQFHEQAVEAPDECRSDLTFVYQLGVRLKRLYAGSPHDGDRPLRDLTWSYEHNDPHRRRRGEPYLERVIHEINGFEVATGAHLGGPRECAADGTTACGCRLYAGMYPAAGRNLTCRRAAGEARGSAWGWSWPNDRRILFNRASADERGRPWSMRKRCTWWDEALGAWQSDDVPDVAAVGSGESPAFTPISDGVAHLFAAGTLSDGPLPTHYEPFESPVANALYPSVQVNPLLKAWPRRDNPYHPPADERHACVLTTYRLAEHFTSGSATRRLRWLCELQPQLFCELSPELAALRGIRHGEWMTIATARGEIEAKALVTGRMQPLLVADGTFVHQVGLPWHWGPLGIVTGDTPNDLATLVGDPVVTIHEAKALTCDVRPGRRSAARLYAADDDVPLGQRNPLGTPWRPGAAEVPSGRLGRGAVTPPATVMLAAHLLHHRNGGDR